jgi:hypothetical protein
MVKQATPFLSTITVKSERRVHPLGNVGNGGICNVLTWSQDLCCILRPGEQAEDDTLGQRPLRSMDDTPSGTSGAKGPAASWQRRSAIAIPRRQLSSVPRTRYHQVVRWREAHRGVSTQLLWRNRSRCLANGASRCRPRLGSGSSFSWQSPNSARIAATCERGFRFTIRKAV